MEAVREQAELYLCACFGLVWFDFCFGFETHNIESLILFVSMP